jgi:uracil-DNA glycosylase
MWPALEAMRRIAMRVNEIVRCKEFPCQAMDQTAHSVPPIDVDPEAVRIFLIAEAPPRDAADGLYAGPGALHAETTLEAFRDAGLDLPTMEALLAQGIYVTTAVKCAKQEYTIRATPIRHCSHLLEQELALFPNVSAYLLMGDVAIRGFNEIARRTTGKRVIPAGSTYRIRNDTYRFGEARVYPSYLQAGKAFYIEKSKREMIAQDLRSALAWVQGSNERG